MLYWNIAGMRGKDKDFWDYCKSFDIIGLTETWLEEREWQSRKASLPKEFRWNCQPATRERSKGRAKGGIITGVRKEIEEINISRVNMVNGVQEGG